MGKYDAYLGSAFRERLDKLTEKGSTLLTLRDELVLMQEMLGQACKRYDTAMEASKDLPWAEQMRIQGIASSMLTEAINNVRDLTLAEHRLVEPGRQIDISLVHALVAQMVGIVDQEIEGGVVGAPAELVSRIAERARQELLTVDAVATTRITPERIDADVRAMHATIPDGPLQLKVS